MRSSMKRGGAPPTSGARAPPGTPRFPATRVSRSPSAQDSSGVQRIEHRPPSVPAAARPPAPDDGRQHGDFLERSRLMSGQEALGLAPDLITGGAVSAVPDHVSEENRAMAYDIAADPRLDPRLKALLAGIATDRSGDVDSREALLAEANSETSRQQAELFRSFMDLCDTEEVAPVGRAARSAPRPSSPRRTATRSTSSSSGPTRTSARLRLLHPRRRHAVHVVLRRHVPRLGQDHRRPGRRGRHGRLPQLRCRPSSAPEVAPFPAGLNDCVSGLKWVAANARARSASIRRGSSSRARAAAAT